MKNIAFQNIVLAQKLFAIGPAGTGKTYLAMAMAVAAFSRGGGPKNHPDPDKRDWVYTIFQGRCGKASAGVRHHRCI